MVELTQIKSRQLLDLFKTVHQRVAVDKQLTGGFGHIEVILKKRLKSNGKLDEDKLTLLKSSAKRVQEIGPLIVQMSEEYDELEEEIESTQNGGRIVISEVAYPGVKMTIANVSSFIHNETKHSAFVRDGAEIRVRAI